MPTYEVVKPTTRTLPTEVSLQQNSVGTLTLRFLQNQYMFTDNQKTEVLDYFGLFWTILDSIHLIEGFCILLDPFLMKILVDIGFIQSKHGFVVLGMFGPSSKSTALKKS